MTNTPRDTLEMTARAMIAFVFAVKLEVDESSTIDELSSFFLIQSYSHLHLVLSYRPREQTRWGAVTIAAKQ